MRLSPLTASAIGITLLFVGCSTPAINPGTSSTSSSSSRSSSAPSVSSSVPSEQVILNTPIAGSIVVSPLTIIGQASGTWFFEGTLPVELVDQSGAVIASGPAKADGNWMTEGLVDFSAELTFKTTAKKGQLMIKNDNPSGDPKNDKQFAVPVNF